LWYLINVVCVIGLVRWAWRVSGGGPLEGAGAPDWREHLVFGIGLACAFRFVMDCLAHQQIDLVIGALLMGGCLALARSRGLLAATAFGLAAALKCTALLWAP